MKTIVSSFEFAIASIADPELAKTMRPETPEERQLSRSNKLDEFMSRVKTTGNMKGKKARLIHEIETDH